MRERMKAAFLCNNPENIERVFGMGRRERLASIVALYPEVITEKTIAQHLDCLKDCECIFSTWGMPVLRDEIVDQMRALRTVFYAAGSVRSFAGSYIDRGVAVVSAWAANGRPVAAFTLAQILLSCKGYFRNTVGCRNPEARISGVVPTGPGIFGARVAIIGAGQIGRQVIELLKPFGIDVSVVDPHLSAESARQLSVVLVSMEDAFSTASVISNHVPDLPETRGIFNADLFRMMVDGATFINTGRGAQVVEEDLVKIAKERSDLTFLLDVTDPEPPVRSSLLYTLPNVQLSSHIAGSIGNEVVNMADCVIEELCRWLLHQPLRYAVTAEMLETMA